MKNKQICIMAEQLNGSNLNEILFPIRVGFYLQKNIRAIKSAYEEIEQARLYLGEQFGILNEKGTGFNILAENEQIVERELNELLELEQDINIHMFKLEDFNEIDLTPEQLSAIIFMIET